MKWPAYPAYKPSGIDWLRDVPEHWEARRLKGVATYWVSNVDKVAAEDEIPVRLCNYIDVYYHDYVRPSMGLLETTATPDEIRRFGLRVGDVVITKDSEEWRDIAVPALVVESAPDLVCGYHLAIVRPRESALAGHFLLRAFQACAVNQQFQVAATGVTRYGLPKSSIGEAWLPLPPPPEQRAIADFLDCETAKIDTLVAKKKALIERLKEKRIALISRTVTRGLPPDAARAAGFDPHPKLKPSGIDWLGDIPEHWDVVRIGHIADKVGSGKTPRGGSQIYQSDGVLLIRSQNVHDTGLRLADAVFIDESIDEDMASTRVEPGDVLLNITGASLGRSCIVPRNLPPANVNQHVCIIRIRPSAANPQFVQRAISAQALQEQIFSFENGSSREGLTFQQVRGLLFGVPPVAEQRAIADFLDRETGKIDGMIAKVEIAIERMQEYRSALITAAVTGKIDVRGAVA